MIRLPLLDDHAPNHFPDPRHALAEPNGLLAFGGDLSTERLRTAYALGIFPWFNVDEPILWWSPDPRCVFRSEQLRPNRSLRRALSGLPLEISIDQAFEQVMLACAAPRPNEHGTWISPAMVEAYVALHAQGVAHSVEVWLAGQLVGGVYGVSIGKLFCGESMFSGISGGSKLALCALGSLLRQWEFPLLDAQVSNPHLLQLGAQEIPRQQFLRHVETLTSCAFDPAQWRVPRIPAALILSGGDWLTWAPAPAV